MMRVPLFSVFIPKTVDEPLLKTLHSGYIGQGPQVEAFETALREALSHTFVLTMNSCTSALHLALYLSGVGPGDEVLTTPVTCMASNTPILALGATPVWVDVDPRNGLIDPIDAERKITNKTKALIGVDWGGLPCDWESLINLGKKYNIKVIDDAAHAFLASCAGKQLSQLADFTCYSLQAIKHITTGDGGILCTKSIADYKRAKLLRWYGIDREGPLASLRCEIDVPEAGHKFHMNDINATIGLSALPYTKNLIAQYKANYTCWMGLIEDANSMLDPEHAIRPQCFTHNCDPSWWICTLLFSNEFQRRHWQHVFTTHGIQVSQVHARNDVHTCFRPFQTHPLPGVDQFMAKMLCFPTHAALTTEQWDWIEDTWKDGVKSWNQRMKN